MKVERILGDVTIKITLDRETFELVQQFIGDSNQASRLEALNKMPCDGIVYAENCPAVLAIEKLLVGLFHV